MSATTPTVHHLSPVTRRTARAPRPAIRTAWAVNALFWAAFAVLEGVNHGVFAFLFAAFFFIAPDLTFLVGAKDARTTRPGQLPPRAVPYYNAAHRALVPLTLMVVYPFNPLVDWAPIFAALCGWMAHISMDRVFGYGLRTKEGYQRG